jgi:hypothetical protein
MRPEDWHRLSIFLEWIAFVLVTPEFLGESGLKYLSTLLQKSAVLIVHAPGVLTFGPFSKLESPSELATQMDTGWTVLKTVWSNATLRNLILSLLVPAPVLVASVALLRWPFRWIPIAVYAIGQINLAFMLHHKFPKFPTGWLSRVPVVGLFLAFVLGSVALISTAFSFSVALWVNIPLFPVSRGLLKLSETAVLRLYLFAMGVIFFTLGKAIQFALVR